MGNFLVKHGLKVVLVSPGIYATTAAAYNPMYKPHVEKNLPWITHGTEYLKNVLDLAGNEQVILKPIRSLKTTGMHVEDGENLNKIFVDPRYSVLRVLSTIAHELIHAEQYFTGKMSIQDGYFRAWNGKGYQMPKSYDEYINLPWEKEAFERQDDLGSDAFSYACKKLSQ
jgi:hypothetical protein